MHRLFLAATAASALALVSGAPSCASSGIQFAQMQSGGLKRTYALYVPAANARPARPLVIMLHGHFGTGLNAMRRYGIVEAAQRYGFIAVAPDGIARGWNDGRETSGPDASVDDVQFIAQLVARLRSQYAIDASRIYAIGMSNGGMFAQYLACKGAPFLAGIASVASSMPQNLACNPAHPLRVAVVDGTADPIVPFNGGGIRGPFRGVNRGGVIGAPRTVSYWTRYDRCTSGPQKKTIPQSGSDPTSIEIQRYGRCTAGTRVAFAQVNGGGHSWPDERGFQLPFTGTVSRHLNATDFVLGALLRSR